MDFKTKIAELESDRLTLKAWLELCLKNEDWHGVSDAAADIRVVEAKIHSLGELLFNQVTEVSDLDRGLQVRDTADTAVRPIKNFCDDCSCGKAEGCGS